MANSPAICTSFKVELLQGYHALGTPPAHTVGVKDVIKAALYYATATRGAGDTVYSTTGEIVGSTGYTTGGVTVTNANEPSSGGTTAFWQPSASIVYATITVTPAMDAVVLYNSSQGNREIAVYTFGSQTITAGTLTLTMPSPDSTNALLRLA